MTITTSFFSRLYNCVIYGDTIIMKNFIHNFIHCGLLGWFLEIIFTAFHSFRKREMKLSGVTSVWMFPIYGMAAFLAPISRLLKGKNFIFRGFVYTGIIFLGEFISGTLLRKKGLCPWNYERSRWNIYQIIRLDYTPCWFLSGLLFERLLLESDNLNNR